MTSASKDRHRGAGGEPAPPRRPPRPSGSRRGSPCRRCAGAASRAACPSFASTTGKQGDRDQGADQRDQHPAVAHAAKEGKRQGDQRQQADRHRGAAEDDRPSRGLHRPLHRLVAALAVGSAPRASARRRAASSRSPPRGRPGRSGTGRSARRRSAVVSPSSEQEGGHDRDDRHRRSGPGRGSDAKTKASTIRAPKPPSSASSSTPGPSLPAPESSAARRSRVRWTGAPPTVAPLSAARAAFSALAFSPNGGVGVGRRVDDREGRAAVVGDEGPIAGRGVGGDPGAGDAPARAAGRPAASSRTHPGAVDRLALRQGDDRDDQGRGVAAGLRRSARRSRRWSPSPPCRGPRTSGRAPRWPVRRPRSRRSSRRDPGEDDDALVGEDPTGQCGHGLPPPRSFGD